MEGKHVIMRKKIEEILILMVKGEDEPEQTLDKLCDLHIVSSSNNDCGHEWEITTGKCVKCGKSKYY